MKYKLITKTTSLMVLVLLSIGSIAQQNDKVLDSNKVYFNKTEVSIEIDPATFVFNGYGIHFRVKPKNSTHYLIGAGVYAMDFPEILVDLNSSNKDKGWDVRLNQGIGLFGEYHFSQVNKKWYVGSQLALQQYKLQKDFFEGEAKYSNILLMAIGILSSLLILIYILSFGVG